LAEIEEIKQLKARYFRLMDTKQWSAWAEQLADDCVLEYVDRPTVRLEGRDAIVEYVRGALDEAISVHQGQMPEIELTGPTSARATWAMSDVVEWTGDRRRNSLRGFGHYEDEYVKEDGTWRVRRMRITRLRVDPLEPRGGIRGSSEKKT
ncbi:MAG: nuclear transport factor 2 family protein, partial [Actinomycetota bacterium]